MPNFDCWKATSGSESEAEMYLQHDLDQSLPLRACAWLLSSCPTEYSHVLFLATEFMIQELPVGLQLRYWLQHPF